MLYGSGDMLILVQVVGGTSGMFQARVLVPSRLYGPWGVLGPCWNFNGCFVGDTLPI